MLVPVSDTYTPSVSLGSSSGGSRSNAENDADSISQRVRLVVSVNPYMADRPDTLLQMAQSPLPTNQLVQQSAQIYGATAADTFASRLKAMDPIRQRGIWASMPKSQQLALGQLGYEPPKDRESSWLDKALGPLDEVAAAGVRGIGDVVMPVVSPALKGLVWVGDRPAHLYRTIRLMDDDSQWLGLAGAIVGGLAVAAAPITFGGSLAAAGAIIGGGLIGANAAAGIQNPTDWWNAFGDAYAGERAFDRPSRAKADALLGDPRLISLAQDVAQLDDFNLGDFARELAGQRDVSVSSMTDKIYSLAEKFGAQGTPEYQQAISSMLTVMNNSTFLEAIKTLQQGKISIGRDVADRFGLDPESGLHSLLSGSLDAAFQVAVDPTLMIGSALKWNAARRFGVTLADGSIGAERLLKVAADPRVVRYQEEFLRGFNAQDLQRITSVTPEMAKMVPALSEYSRGLQIGEEGLSRPQLLEWLTGSEGLEALLRGQGSVRGAKGIQLANLSRRSEVARKLRLESRVFIGAVSDVRLEQNIRKIVADAAESGDQEVIDHMGTWSDALINRETGKLYGEHQAAAMAGRGIGTISSRIPKLNRIPELIESMSTMIPSGRAIALTGADAPKDIKALSELGRYMGMPSWARRAWADTILFSDNTGARMNAVHGWLDNALTMSGARNTRRGEELVDRYLEHSLQTYGPDTEHIVNGTAMRRGLFLNENADQIPWPSIRELKDAARTGSILEAIGMDRAAMAEFESKAMKVWKPAVLLRIGFIPRASGEEMVNHLFRGGFGSLVQEFGSRTLARSELYKAFALHDADALARVEDLIQDPKVLAKAAEQFGVAGIEAMLPTHIRPLATMLAGRDWAEPVVNALEHYGTWVNGMLEKGLPVIRGAETPIEGALAAIRGSAATGARSNLARNAESILLGNEASWRRMMLGGVNDEMVDSAIAYQAAYADSLMRHLGTTTAGVWDPGYDPATYQTRQVQRGGRVEEQPVVVLTGQPQVYTNDRWEYAHGVWYQARQPMQDPVAAQIARDYLPRMRAGTNVADEQIDTLFDLTEQMGTDVGRRIMYEFLGADDAGQVRVAVNSLRQVDPGLSEHLARYLSKNGDISIDDVISGVRKYKGTNEAARKALLDDLKRVKAINATIAPMDAASRNFAAALVRTVDGDSSRTLLDGWRTYRSEASLPTLSGPQAGYFHGSSSEVPEFSEWGSRSARNLYGPGVYTTDTPDVAGMYMGKGAGSSPNVYRVEWTGTGEPRVLDMAAPHPEVTRAVQSEIEYLDSSAMWEDMDDALFANLRALADDPTTPADQLYDALRSTLSSARRPVADADEVLDGVTQGLLDSGVDALSHAGGQRTGGVGHGVTIWLDQRKVKISENVTGQVNRALNPPTSPFVGGWGDLDNDIAATYRNGVQNTYNQEAASRSQRITGLPDGDPMKDGTVLAWRAPSLRGFGSVEEIAALAPDPGVIMRNREAVERIMRDSRVSMLSDRELANQLAEATTSPLVAHSLPRRVLNGREEFGGGLIPVVKRTTGDRSEVMVWSADGTMFPSSSAASYQSLDDKVTEMADLAQGRARQLWTKGVRQQTTARGRLVRDAEGNETTVATLFESNPLDARGMVVPIEPGTPLTQDRWYFTRSGKRVKASEPRYTDTVTLDQGEGEVMWPLIGPMIEDSWDAKLGLTRFKPKDAVVFGRDGDILASGDVVPVLRSRPGHVMGIEGLPTHATFPTIRAVERTGMERISDFGFNKVLGPAIDRLSRQPMAFHQFDIRYRQARAMQRAFEDPVALERLGAVAQKVSARSVTPEVESLLDDIKLVAVADGVPQASKFTDVQASAWVRGHGPQELSDLLEGAAARSTTTRGTKAAIERLRAMEPDDVITTLGARMPTGDDLLAFVRARVPNDDLTSIERFRNSRRAQQVRETNPILSQLDDNDWETIITAFGSRARANTLAGEIAASAAINDIVPFLDSHEFKTQFAQEMGAFLPFHYAEENFIKRWVRTFADQGPLSTARKMQLTYAGIKTGGLVRSDAQGNDYFVVPGSGLLIEALSRVFPGASVLPVGAMLQMQTKSLLPGINEQFGSPSVSPLVSVPLALSEHFFPEMNTVQRVVVGDYGASRSIMQQVVPAHFQRLFEVVGQDENSSARWNSAMLTAIAQLEANDDTALPDDATAGQRDEYLRKVREHARIILTSQALAGFFLPTSPQVVNTGESGQVDNILNPAEWASNFRKATGYGIDDPRGALSDLFYGMVSELGIEEGTQQFLATYPNLGLEDITNPLALVQGMSESRSGAPLPATAEAVKFYDDNADYMAAAPYAGPWLMPPADSDQRRVQYAYDQQTINGLRKRETPDDFLTSIKYKEAAGEYFDSQRAYLDMVSQAEANGQDTKTLKAQWDIFAATYKAAHPIFAEQLTSGEGQQRRRKVLEEMRTVVADPGAPDSDQLRLLTPVMQSFDSYRLQLAILSDDRSAEGRAKIEQMKLAWSNWLDGYVSRNPKSSSFVSAVIRPESDL